MHKKIIIGAILFFYTVAAWSFPARFSVSPDNSQQLLLDALQSAQSSIVLNVYMLTSTRIQQVILDKLAKGVTVQMILETEPYGIKVVPPQKKLMDTLADAIKKAGKNNKFLMVNSKNGTVQRRYVFDHAKYIVIDGTRAYISSENFVGTGAMSDPRRKGNRGWQVLLDDKNIAQQLTAIFNQDADPTTGDISEYDSSFIKILDTPFNPPSDNGRNITPFAGGNGDVASASLCVSPKSQECLFSFIRNAKTSLDLQQLSLPVNWGTNSKKVLSPFITEITNAAKRGVKIRVLVNQYSDEAEGTDPNSPPNAVASETVAYLQKIATDQSLPIQAAINNNKDLQLVVVHNKGMLADGNRVWVGSINGTENSFQNNREVAVNLESTDAAKYYQQVFDFDWSKSK